MRRWRTAPTAYRSLQKCALAIVTGAALGTVTINEFFRAFPDATFDRGTATLVGGILAAVGVRLVTTHLIRSPRGSPAICGYWIVAMACIAISLVPTGWCLAIVLTALFHDPQEFGTVALSVADPVAAVAILPFLLFTANLLFVLPILGPLFIGATVVAVGTSPFVIWLRAPQSAMIDGGSK